MYRNANFLKQLVTVKKLCVTRKFQCLVFVIYVILSTGVFSSESAVYFMCLESHIATLGENTGASA